jgi:hypothetical protein
MCGGGRCVGCCAGVESAWDAVRGLKVRGMLCGGGGCAGCCVPSSSTIQHNSAMLPPVQQNQDNAHCHPACSMSASDGPRPLPLPVLLVLVSACKSAEMHVCISAAATKQERAQAMCWRNVLLPPIARQLHASCTPARGSCTCSYTAAGTRQGERSPTSCTPEGFPVHAITPYCVITCNSSTKFLSASKLPPQDACSARTCFWWISRPGSYTGGGERMMILCTPAARTPSTMCRRLSLYSSTGTCCRSLHRTSGRGGVAVVRGAVTCHASAAVCVNVCSG